jgi:hypothetical protein
MNGLMNNFKTEYLKPDAPEEHRDMVDKLTAIIADFVQQVGQSIQRTELLLRELEQYLDLWNEWAACRRDNPPPRQTVRDILREVRRIRWPSPPIGHVDEVKKKAGKQIGKIPGSVPGGRRNIPGSSQGMIISGSYQMSSVSMKSLNEYIPYLNETWQGDVPTFDWEKGFRVSLGWRFTPHFEAGTFFERMTASVSGTFQAFMSRYTSEHTLNVYGLYVSAASDEVFSVLRFVSQAGIGYYDATYREQEDAFVTEGKDHTIGWHTAGGLDIALSENLSVHVMAGYRHAALHEFDTSFFMPGDPPVALEFTGFCGWAGLSFRF